MDSYLDSNRLSCEKNWTLHLVLVGLMAGWQADEIWLDFEIFKVLYKLNYVFGFLLLLHQCNVINSVRSAFQSAFVKQSVFMVYSVVHEIRSPFFSCRSLLLGTSIPNDMCHL